MKEILKVSNNNFTIADLMNVLKEHNMPLNTPITINGGELRHIYTDGRTLYLEETDDIMNN